MKASVWYVDRRIEVDADPTPVPGLIINENPGAPGIWVVTHEPSGTAVLKLPDRRAALFAADRLAPLADWLLPGSALRGTPGLDHSVQDMACRLDCWELTFQTGSSIVSDDQLAETEAS